VNLLAHIVTLLMILFVLYMYKTPIQAISYSYLLIIGISFIYLTYDFSKFYQKNHKLKELLKQINIQLEDLPEINDLTDENYQQLLERLYQEKYQLTQELDQKQADFYDYSLMWAHQIKTPIAAMRLLLQTGDFPSNLSQELFKIEQYVEMLLHYLRVEDISHDFRFNQVQLSKIIKEATKKYASIFISKQIRLELEEIDVMILTDEKWLQFAIEQLLSNALKYTNNSGVIKIYMENEQLVIEDSGIGIQVEDLPRIFEKGFTGYNGRMDKKSTGIGLFLIKKIVDKLGVGILVTSQIGVGTKVSLKVEK
jgi:signal transduction histidine kinase